jgi:hypothetical protein
MTCTTTAVYKNKKNSKTKITRIGVDIVRRMTGTRWRRFRRRMGGER